MSDPRHYRSAANDELGVDSAEFDNPNYSEIYLDLLKSALCASLYDESAWRIVEGPMRQHIASAHIPGKLIAAAKHAFLNFLRANNLSLVRMFPFDAKIRASGLDWPLFGFTMTGRKRLDALHACINEILKVGIPGDFIETGVWRGGASIYARAVMKANGATDRTVWVADSFEGLPKPDAAKYPADSGDRHFFIPELAIAIEQVQANFRTFNLLDNQVQFLKGWFKDTLPKAPIKKLAVARLDGDLYESTMDALVNLYPKLSAGGYLIVDDYGAVPACKKAIHDYRDANGIKDPLQEIDVAGVFWQKK